MISYTIVVKNEGEGTATGIEVRDTLPSGLQYQSFNIVRGTGIYNSTTFKQAIPLVFQHQEHTLTLPAMEIVQQKVVVQ